MRVQVESPEGLDALLKFLRERGHRATRSAPNQVSLVPQAAGDAYHEEVSRDLAMWHFRGGEPAWIVPE